MPTLDLGPVVGPQGATGAQGATGPQGAQGIQGEPGPNQVSSATSTNLTGVLTGNGSAVGSKAVDTAPAADSTNLVSSGGVYAALEKQAIRPNLLDNWYFVGGGSQQGGGQFPINQRGSSSYSIISAGLYSIDRWRGSGSMTSSNPENVALSSGYVTLSCNSSAGFSQRIENYAALAGKTVTVSFLVEVTAGKYGIVIHDGSSHELIEATPNGKQLYTAQYSVPSSISNFYVYLDGKTSPCSAKLYAAKLEIGSTQTLAHWDETAQKWVLNEVPNFEVELAKCQRYFQTLKSSFSPMFYGGALSGTTVNIFIPLPVTMRSSPTLSPSPIPLDVFNGSTYTSDVNVTINSATSRENGIRINGTSDKSLTSGAISAQIREQATTTLTLSADL